MRSIKELLQIMLDNQSYFSTGLCDWAKKISISQRLTNEEFVYLRQYINDNRPSALSSVDAFKHRNSGFYWKHSNIAPRIKWIKKHIKRNS